MGWHRLAIAATLPLLLLSCFLENAQAVPVGCYPLSSLELSSLEDVGYEGQAPTTAALCEEACYNANSPKPLAVFSAGNCSCTSIIPDVFEKLPLKECVVATTNAAKAPAAAGVTLMYAHHVPKEQCTVSPVPFFSNWWQDRDGLRINFTQGNTEYDRAKDMLHLRLTKNLGALKLYTVDSWAYGYYTVKMIPFGPGIGAVTTIYTSSSYADEDQPPENRNPWDEINLSFPSSYPSQFPETLTKVQRVRAAIGAVWTKNWKDQIGSNETLIPADDLKKLVGDPNFSAFNGPAWYGFNWQPKNIDWFVKGVNIDRIPADHPLPSQPSRFAVGVWRPDGGNCWYFGGCNNSQPYEAYFSDVRRIVCGDSKTIAAYELINYSPSPPPPPSPNPFPPPMPPVPSPPPGQQPAPAIVLGPAIAGNASAIGSDVSGLLSTTASVSSGTSLNQLSILLALLSMVAILV